MNPAISILMPVRNAENFLGDCLHSIIEQDLKNWELIAVNDGSTDSSLEILQKWVQADARIEVIDQPPLGIIHALRAAFAASSGNWITRMDADDLMHAEKLSALLQQAQSFGKGHLIVGRVKYFREDGVGDGYQKYEQWLNGLGSGAGRWEGIYKECVIPSPCWMVHRDDLKNAGAFQSDTYPEDYDLCFRFFAAGLIPIYTVKALHHWRDHEDRSSRNDPNYADNNFTALKVNHFLELSHDSNRHLILSGASTKGKAIAKILIARGVAFNWITNNPLKIGNNIYGKILKADTDENLYQNPEQWIIAFAGKKDQLQMKKELAENKLIAGKDYFFFA